MRLCRDCQFFTDRRWINDDAGRRGWSPQWCSRKIGPIDPISGHQDRVGDPTAARSDEDKCGKEGKWFIPGTLDGKLALLYEQTEEAEKNEPPRKTLFGVFRRRVVNISGSHPASSHIPS